jgi:ATP-dependent DNA ligase
VVSTEPTSSLIVEALTALKVTSVTIDGEAVWCEPLTGLAIFDRLHCQAHNDHVFLFDFDLLELDGDDLRSDPLSEPKGSVASPICFRVLLRSAPTGLGNP